MIQTILNVLGKVIGVIAKLLKVAIVLSIIQGFSTGNWRNFAICALLVVFIVLTSRYAGNMIAFFSTIVPFPGEVFDVDPSLREKGERFIENGFNIFGK